MWLADLFTPGREDRFFQLLRRQVDILNRVTKAFRDYVHDCSSTISDEISRLEKEADDVLTDLTNAVRDTFVTPIDRQDIYNLGEAIDDMIDYINSAAQEISIFKVTPTDSMYKIAAILDDAAAAIADAVSLIKSDPQGAWARARQVQAAENEVEEIYRSELASLFDQSDVSRVFKLREVYRHLSNSADRAEAIGRLIGKIVVKTS